MKIFLGVLIALSAAGGAYYYLYAAPKAAQEEAQQRAQENAANQPVTEMTTGAQYSPAQMEGIWRSGTDSKFTREIRADGAIVDSYEGDAAARTSGVWSIVDPIALDIGVPTDRLTGKTVVRAEWEGGIEVTFFSIEGLGADRMTITDLTGQGEVTNFTRVH